MRRRAQRQRNEVKEGAKDTDGSCGSGDAIGKQQLMFSACRARSVQRASASLLHDHSFRIPCLVPLRKPHFSIQWKIWLVLCPYKGNVRARSLMIILAVVLILFVD